MKRRPPLTFFLGLFGIIILEALLAYDVIHHGRGVAESDADVRVIYENPRNTCLEHAGRYVAINMTPLAWPMYLLLLDGVLAWQRISPIRARKHHFAMMCLASVFIWCVFDAINFNRGMRAWEYVGMPHHLRNRIVGYLWAFACIVPGMTLSAQTLLNTKFFDRAMRGPSWDPHHRLWIVVLLIGVAMFAWPLLHPNPLTNLTLWTSLLFLLDPINDRLGRPSLLRDWTRGWYGRTVALMLGGLMCGLLWEFWNYWALAKWVYHLPFLGPLEHVRYFQMPLPGLLGFLAFGPECWVMWQTIRIPFDGLVEPLESDRDVM